MNCKEIITLYLKAQGFDGLYNADWECGCLLDDLMPCNGEQIQNCEPGYKLPCDCGDHDFHVGLKESADFCPVFPPEVKPEQDGGIK